MPHSSYSSWLNCPKNIWILLMDNIFSLKLDWTGRVINLAVSSVCICPGQISFLAALYQ
jgi:hypothetical protein